MSNSPTWGTFSASDYEFRILEFDLPSQMWAFYHVGEGIARDGYGARRKAEQLNNDYADYGRKFKVQRRPLGVWEDVS